MRNALRRRFLFVTPAAAALWLTVCFAPAGGAHAAGEDAKAAALQTCPAIEEEIVDLERLAEGLKNSTAVSLLEKLRLRSAINDLIGRLEAFHNGIKAYSPDELQQQYDVLLMRIAAHLQHKDQVLHGQLCNAWDAIWRDLIDSSSFAKRSW